MIAINPRILNCSDHESEATKAQKIRFIGWDFFTNYLISMKIKLMTAKNWVYYFKQIEWFGLQIWGPQELKK